MSELALEARLVARTPAPGSRLAMRQQWRDLLFLHWEFPTDLIQQRLPDGLTVDTFEGRAFVGVVPFFMRNVRPRGLLAAPWLSSFLELNVRTYVYDHKGVPGVWFFSLDANQPLAVEIARRWYHLPYKHAKMSAKRKEGRISYSCRRRGQDTAANYHYDQISSGVEAEPGSLEFFFLERYVLYSWNERRRRLYRGYVKHKPYRFAIRGTQSTSAIPLAWEGFDAGENPPIHAAVAAGFNVEAFAIEPVSQG